MSFEIKFTDEEPVYGRAFRAPPPLENLVHVATPMFQQVITNTTGIFTGHYMSCLGILTTGNNYASGPKGWEAWIVDEPVTCLLCLAGRT